MMLRLTLPIAVAAAFATGCLAGGGGDASARQEGRTYTGRQGDTFRVPAAAVRCTVSQEGGATNVTCAHTPKARYNVVYYKDNLFVYRNGEPDNPVFSARGRP